MKKTIQVLKSYFTAGYKPTESHFENLIDSLATPMIGEIKTVSFTTVPKGWAKCDGQLLSISENEILFNLIGTAYGGDGVTTFALPNLQERVMIHNNSNYLVGQIGGVSETTLTENQLPTHNHDIGNIVASHNLTGATRAATDEGTSDEAEGNILATGIQNLYAPSSFSDTLMSTDGVQIIGNINLSGTTANTGNATPVNTMPPYLVVNAIIALEGIDPLAV
jgi:microcystin-dependent protein